MDNQDFTENEYVLFEYLMPDSSFKLIKKTSIKLSTGNTISTTYRFEERMADGTEVFSEYISNECGNRFKTILDRIYTHA